MNLDFSVIERNFPLFIDGVIVTVQLSGLAILLALLWGLVLVTARMSSIRMLNLFARSIVELFRNTPVLIQMYFIFFGSGLAGYPVSGFAAGLAALALQNGCYISEIYRAGIESVARGQTEAGLALGMQPAQAFRCVVLPQALRSVLPPVTNQGVIIIKDSSLVSTLSVAEVTFQARLLADSTAATYEIFLTLAAFYLIITGLFSGGMRLLEMRVRVIR